MAMILIDDYRPRIVSPKQGALLWMIKQGYVKAPSKAWSSFAERTKKIYLNPANAPEDYKAEHPQLPDEPVRTAERWIPIETRKDLM